MNRQGGEAASKPAEPTNLYVTMALIRAFETAVAELYRDGRIPGFVHTSLGQEAVATGVCAALAPDDYMTTTHRGHGHVLAKGADLNGMMAELFGKAEGLCAGKGGSMHVADPRVGILGANAIVGAGVPLATGAALASKLQAQGRIAVSFFGEGAVNQGMFHEAVNLAAIWDLPVLYVCENNGYAEFTDSSTMSRIPEVAARAETYGIPAQSIDGNDVFAVHEAACAAVERCRAGEGPFLIEALTYRHHGHYEGDAQTYKPDEEQEKWRQRDPLAVAEARLLESGALDRDRIEAIKREAEDRVEAAKRHAEAAADPEPEEAFKHVFTG